MSIRTWLWRFIRGRAATETVEAQYPDRPRRSNVVEMKTARELERLRFKAFMDETAQRMRAPWRLCAVAGLRYNNDDGTSRQAAALDLSPCAALQLVRELDHPYSSNAVKILDGEGRQLGYVVEWLAQHVAQALDSGGEAAAYVDRVTDHFEGGEDEGVVSVEIGVLWRPVFQDPEAFAKWCEHVYWADEWMLAEVENFDGPERQQRIGGLFQGAELSVYAKYNLGLDDMVTLVWDGAPIATIAKEQAAQILAGVGQGKTTKAYFFGARERSQHCMEPVVALIRYWDNPR